MWCKLVKLCLVFYDFQEEKLCPPLTRLTSPVLDRPWGARPRKLNPICHGWSPQARQDTRCQARKYPPTLYCWPPWADQTLGCQAEQDTLTHPWLPNRDCAPSFVVGLLWARGYRPGKLAMPWREQWKLQNFHIWPPSHQPGQWLSGQGNRIPLPWLISTGQAYPWDAKPGKSTTTPRGGLPRTGQALGWQAEKDMAPLPWLAHRGWPSPVLPVWRRCAHASVIFLHRAWLSGQEILLPHKN